MPLIAALAVPEPLWEQPRTLDAAQGGGWGSQRVALFSGLRLVPTRGLLIAVLLQCMKTCCPASAATRDASSVGKSNGAFGCSVKAVAATVEVLEESGLPPLCVAMADAEDAQQPLGRVLAETVRVSGRRLSMCHARAGFKQLANSDSADSITASGGCSSARARVACAIPLLQDHRGRKNPSKQLWEESPHVSDALPDLDTLIKEATSDRLRVGTHILLGVLLVHLWNALAVHVTRHHGTMHVHSCPASRRAATPALDVRSPVSCWMCGLLFASQEFDTAAKEGRLDEVLAEGAIEMTPEEVQQLKAREAADAAAATVTNAGSGPQAAGADTPISRQHPASSGAAAAGATPEQQQPQRAAAADTGQAQPVHSAPVVPEMSAAAGATPEAQQPQSAAAVEPSQARPVHGVPPVPDMSKDAAAPADRPGSEAGNANTADSLRSSQKPFGQPANRFQYNPGAQNVPNMKGPPATPSKRQQPSRHSMYQQPAGPQPPPGMLEREQFLSELRRRQQQEQQDAQAGAEQQWRQQQQQQQPPLPDAEPAAASQPSSDAQEAFLAKYTFETLAMQREAAAAADVPVGPLGWQAELALVSYAAAL